MTLASEKPLNVSSSVRIPNSGSASIASRATMSMRGLLITKKKTQTARSESTAINCGVITKKHKRNPERQKENSPAACAVPENECVPASFFAVSGGEKKKTPAAKFCGRELSGRRGRARVNTTSRKRRGAAKARPRTGRRRAAAGTPRRRAGRSGSSRSDPP